MSQNNSKSSVTSISLLSDGKSTRLMELRAKAMGEETVPTETQIINESIKINKLNKIVMADLLYARESIDKKIASILSKYLVNKQAKLFKIRFGLSVEQMKGLSIKEINSILGIVQKKGLISDLDYFGNKK